MSVRKSLLNSAIKSVTERQVRVIVSDDTPDRADDIVVPTGIDFKNYLKNPVVLYQHDHDHPVARCIELTLTGNKLVALVEFPPEGTSEKSDETFRLVKSGVINAVSIGFIPRKYEDIEDSRWGLKFTESEMLEFSFVSVPCNPNALVIERSADRTKLLLACTDEQATKYKGALVRYNKDHPEYDGLPFVKEIGDTEGKVIASWIGKDAEDKDVHAVAVEFLSEGFNGLLRNMRADQFVLSEPLSTPAASKGVPPTPEEPNPEDVPPSGEPENDDEKAIDAFLVVVRAGRTISSANEAKLREAHTAIGEVLAQVEEPAPSKALLERRMKLLRLKAHS